MVDRRGIEPRLKACKAPVLPLSLPAQNLVANGGFEPPTPALSALCSTPELTGQTWRCQGVTISFFERDRLACVHEHFGTKFVLILLAQLKLANIQRLFVLV